jgi:NADH-quinone oxidoreductase subunit E
MNRALVDNILDHYQRNPGQIIAILHQLQDQERYLPEEELRYIARQLVIPASQIFHISTFYKAFSLKPKGKHVCNVCMGTACHVRGAPLVLEELERKLRIRTGGTTEDGEFSLDTVNCLGACALGPLVTVDGEYFGNMSTAKVNRVLRKATAERKDATKSTAGETEA